MKVLYEIIVVNIGGRIGEVYFLDNIFNLDVVILLVFGGEVIIVINSEQLFVVGYSVCFNSVLEFMLKKYNVEIKRSEVKVIVQLFFDKVD